jgi:hypothetical protein
VVEKYGKECWVAVATLVPAGRTSEQCRRRLVRNLDPANEKNVGKWTPEEDAKLTEAVQKPGNNWITVATLVPGRMHKQCRQRWVLNLDPDRASNPVEEEHNAGMTRRWTRYRYDRMAHSAKGISFVEEHAWSHDHFKLQY